MDADIKYILDSVQEDIDTVSLFGRGADEDVQRARRGFEKLKAALAPAPVAVDFAQAVTCVQNYLEHDAKTGIVRTRTISVPRWVLEDLIQAATSQQALTEEPAFEYLPGDGPTKVSEAFEILDRVTTAAVASSMNYEALCKVRAIFRKYLAAHKVIKLKGE